MMVKLQLKIVHRMNEDQACLIKTRMYVCMFVCLYVYTYIGYTHTHIHTHVCMYILMYVCSLCINMTTSILTDRSSFLSSICIADVKALTRLLQTSFFVFGRLPILEVFNSFFFRSSLPP